MSHYGETRSRLFDAIEDDQPDAVVEVCGAAERLLGTDPGTVRQWSLAVLTDETGTEAAQWAESLRARWA